MIEIDGVKYQEEDLTQEGVVRAERIGYLKDKLVQLIKEQQEGINHNHPPSESEADG